MRFLGAADMDDNGSGLGGEGPLTVGALTLAVDLLGAIHVCGRRALLVLKLAIDGGRGR